MILKPQNREELAAMLADDSTAGRKVERVDLAAIAGMVEHSPEDMTASVEAGMSLATFQANIRRHGQWLPIDPANAAGLTIGDLLANDFSGPRRLGYGIIRDYAIGIKVALADGRLIKAGGKVVKNVAGYDLCKLFIGAKHSLGIIVEATFKLKPVPEMEMFMRARVGSLDELVKLRRELIESATEPVIFDAHNLDGEPIVAVAFAGYREDVELQAGIAERLGFAKTEAPIYFERFWVNSEATKVSVLPSKTVETIAQIRPERFVAHLGNGVIYYRGGNAPAESGMPVELMGRIKRAYDPKSILPSYTG